MRRIIGLIPVAVLFCGTTLGVCPSAWGQDEIPTKINNQNRSGELPFSATIGTDIEYVDIASGNLLINIPIASVPGRGMDLGFSLRYGARFLVVATRFSQPNGYYSLWNLEEDPNDLNSVTPLTVGWGTSQTNMSNGTRQILCVHDPGTETWFMTVRAAYMLRDSSGAKHPFAYQTATGCAPSVTDDDAPDLTGSGMRATLASSYPTIKLSDGTARINGLPHVWRDSNGNERGEAPGGTDTLGRVPVTKQAGTNWIQYKVNDSDGNLRTYTVNFTNITLSTQFNVIGPGGPAAEFTGTRKVVSSILLPNSRSYSFQYNAAYAEMTRVDLPAGGSVVYTWATLSDEHRTHRYVTSRTVVVNGQSHIWNFARSGSGNNITVTVTDPDNNQAVYQVSAGAITSAKFYQGAATGTPLREYTMTYTWDSDPLSSFHSDSPGYEAAKVGMRLTSITTTLETGLASKKEFTYDQLTYNFHNCLEAGCYEGGSWPVSQYTTSRGNVLEIREYDWGQGGPGSLVRRTARTYLHGTETEYVGYNIVSKILKETIYDGSNNKKAEAEYEYDSTPLIATSGAPQHNSGYSTGFTPRGNATKIKRWRNTDGALLTTTYNYDDLGNIRSISDPLTHTTNYTYSDSWGGVGCLPPSNSQAYMTEATNHLGHRVQFEYFPCTGLRQERRDENDIAAGRSGVTSSYDLLGRLVQQNFPDGGQTSYNHDDVPPVTITTTTALSATQNLLTLQTLDGLGRVTQVSLTSDPQGSVNTDTTYDAFGRKETVSNPYRSTTEPTYGVTSFQYDALSRVTKVIPPDGTESSNNVTTVYSGNATLVTDQAGKQRRSFSDALGRLIQVDEFQSGATPPTAGTGSVGVTGSLQSTSSSATPGTGSVTISGSVQTNGYPVWDPNFIADSGDVYITVNGYTAFASYSYGTTAANIASSLRSAFNSDTASPVTAGGTGSTVTLTSKQSGSNTNYPLSAGSFYDTGNFSSPSFNTSTSGSTLTGGSGGTTYDSGTVWIQVISSTYRKTVSYGQGSSASSIASALRSAINGDANYPVTASSSGGTVTLTAKTTGPTSNYSLSAGTTWNTSLFAQASFTATPSGATLTGGSDGAPGGSAATTYYTYDVLDNLIGVVQSGSRQRTFTYNSLSQLTQAVNPESGTINYTYDSDGNLLTKVAPQPNQTGSLTVTTTYAYDALHRLTSKTYSNGDPAVSYFYDQTSHNGLSIANGKGRRTGMNDAAGAQAWSYDVMGRVLADRRTTNSVTRQFNYTYRLDGSVATLACPSGRVITYAYNGAGQAVSAVDAANSVNYATGALYAPHGGLASLLNGATLTTKQYFNNRLQPCRLSISTGSTPANCTSTTNGSVFDLAYDFDSEAAAGVQNNGNVGKITNKRSTSRTQSFTYDALNRLATAQSQATSGSLCWGLAYGYDIWGNLLTATVTKCSAPALSLTVNTSNRITSSGYGYDAAGNMTTVAGISGSLVYNAENQMTSGAGVSHTYDGDGRRVKKSNGTLYWYGLAGEVLQETNLTGGLLDEYIFFNGQRTARRAAAGTVYYFFSDHLGSARVVTNATGGIVEESDYYPFGGERVITDTLNNQYKFTGKERDGESGLDYFIARHYSSTIGRFIQPDPLAISEKLLENPQDLNLYSYTINNPLRYADPDGQDWKDVLLGVGEGTVNLVSNGVQGAAFTAYAASPFGVLTGANKDLGEAVVGGVVTAGSAYANEGVAGVAEGVLAQGEQGAMAIITEAVGYGALSTAALRAPIESAAGTRPGVPTALGAGSSKPLKPPGENAAAAAGRAADSDFASKVKSKPGWQSQPSIKGPQGQTLRPDALTRSGRPLERKPNTPSGRRRGSAQLMKYEAATGKKGRLLLYDPAQYKKP